MVSKTNVPRCRRNSTVSIVPSNNKTQDREPKTEPFFSIVVPTKNNENQIESCIKSLPALDYPRDKYEIIVSDGHSRDRTATIARSYGVIPLEDDDGCRASGCNMGFRHSKGEFIAARASKR